MLDRTVGLVRNKPCLMKDADLEPGVLGMVKRVLREKVGGREVRRCVEGGRLWDWWVVFEDGVVGERMESVAGGGGFGF